MNNEQITKLREELKTQDNLATANPLFVVYEWERVPTDSEYSDEYEYVDTDLQEVIGETEEELVEHVKSEGFETPTTAEFNAMQKLDVLAWIKDKNLGEMPIERVHYLKKRRFITACFTRNAAQDFIDANDYHYKEPHIYVETLWRNHEMQMIRNALLTGEFEDLIFPESVIESIKAQEDKRQREIAEAEK